MTVIDTVGRELLELGPRECVTTGMPVDRANARATKVVITQPRHEGGGAAEVADTARVVDIYSASSDRTQVIKRQS